MKKFIFFIIILSCFMIFSSCGEREIKNISTEIELDEENGGGTGILANNKTADFYFYYPENFFIQRSDDMITVSANDSEDIETDIKDPDSDEYFPVMGRTNLSVTVFGLIAGKYETADEYWENYMFPAYEEMFHDFKIAKKRSPKEGENEEDIDDDIDDLTVDGIPAKKYTYTVSLAGMKYKISEVIFFRKQKVYTLTYTSTENKYQNYISVLNTAVDTFRFK